MDNEVANVLNVLCKAQVDCIIEREKSLALAMDMEASEATRSLASKNLLEAERSITQNNTTWLKICQMRDNT